MPVILDYNLATLPRPLSIVWCWFPLSEKPHEPGDKCRPCLVKSAKMDDHGQGWIEVAYGTTKLDTQNYSGRHLIIQNAEDLAEIGLPSATRFAIDRCVWLPWKRELFSCPGTYTEVQLGRLNDRQTRKLMTIAQKHKARK